jgi:hypothetical protein
MSDPSPLDLDAIRARLADPHIEYGSYCCSGHALACEATGPLLDELERVTAELDEVSYAGNLAEDDAEMLGRELAQARAELAALRETAEQTRSTLLMRDGQLNYARSNASDLDADLATTRAEMARLRAELAALHAAGGWQWGVRYDGRGIIWLAEHRARAAAVRTRGRPGTRELIRQWRGPVQTVSDADETPDPRPYTETAPQPPQRDPGGLPGAIGDPVSTGGTP